MPTLTYAEKLKDPRWQKKRLEVLNYYDFACDECGNNKNELHVHHIRYLKKTEPWDYPIELLRSVCKPCHGLITEVDRALAGNSEDDEIRYMIEAIKFSLREIASSQKSNLRPAIWLINEILSDITPSALFQRGRDEEEDFEALTYELSSAVLRAIKRSPPPDANS